MKTADSHFFLMKNNNSLKRLLRINATEINEISKEPKNYFRMKKMSFVIPKLERNVTN